MKAETAAAIIDRAETLDGLTLERGLKTEITGIPTLYGHKPYPISSVLAGKTMWVFLECWDEGEDDRARAELKAAGIEFTDMLDGGTAPTTDQLVKEVAEATLGFPDGAIDAQVHASAVIAKMEELEAHLIDKYSEAELQALHDALNSIHDTL